MYPRAVVPLFAPSFWFLVPSFRFLDPRSGFGVQRTSAKTTLLESTLLRSPEHQAQVEHSFTTRVCRHWYANAENCEQNNEKAMQNYDNHCLLQTKLKVTERCEKLMRKPRSCHASASDDFCSQSRCERAPFSLCVCVCVCVCARACVCVYVYVYVCH